ncbi:protein-methionine-sulfoxide reductase heme-binding subunit MsrQ [Burkholderia latens]|uniref:Protein-methionine-sulfoxide reductase heme-binding subunit MsrQ n=1 Tax=Burkholderia latens TaxID=488446 RepID=A0A6H9SQM3_9BURK|nr:protein-methionine-sulfoxide reductase heme-binding subunit MsrQ [Burkholderia latens]KAB0640764.1 protein-methionine-sulfoxide reductase heme-binding subunit MsrQ [Burkholderia latens]VWB37062.1 sulfite oxidase [Burkholderia latens]
MRPSTLTPERAPRPRRAAAAGGSSRTGGAVRPAAPRWLAPAKVLAFAAGLYPLARLVLFTLTDRLGANPIEFITRSTGLWTLVMLCVTLAVTPLRRAARVPALLRFRRMIGLFAFFYATLHFTTYLWFDKWFDVLAILKDVGKRPFITVGFAAFVLLIPLAATSPRAMVRRLGRHWTTLHRAIYAIALFGVLHFWWMRSGKHDLAQPKVYATIVAALLGWRLLDWGWRRIRA